MLYAPMPEKHPPPYDCPAILQPSAPQGCPRLILLMPPFATRPCNRHKRISKSKTANFGAASDFAATRRGTEPTSSENHIAPQTPLMDFYRQCTASQLTISPRHLLLNLHSKSPTFYSQPTYGRKTGGGFPFQTRQRPHPSQPSIAWKTNV